MTAGGPGQVVQHLKCSITPEPRRVSAGLLKARDHEIWNRITGRIGRQPGQAKLRGNVGRRHSKRRRCGLLCETRTHFIQQRRGHYKIVGHGQTVIGFGQRESAQERGSINSAPLLGRHLHAAFLPCEAGKGRLPGVDVLIEPQIGLVAGNGRREVLNIVVRNCVRRSRVRKREEIFQNIL